MRPKLAQEILPPSEDPHQGLLDRLPAQPVPIAYRIKGRVVWALDPSGPEPIEPMALCVGIVQGRKARRTGWPVSEGGVVIFRSGRHRISEVDGTPLERTI